MIRVYENHFFALHDLEWSLRCLLCRLRTAMLPHVVVWYVLFVFTSLLVKSHPSLLLVCFCISLLTAVEMRYSDFSNNDGHQCEALFRREAEPANDSRRYRIFMEALAELRTDK